MKRLYLRQPRKGQRTLRIALAFALAVVLGLPASSLAAAFTNSTSSIGATGVAVEGFINPEGSATQYHVEYGLQGSAWCESAGSSGVAEHTTTSEPLGFNNPTTVNLTGLIAGDKYCAELFSSTGSGTDPGGYVFFTVGVPSVYPSDAYSISPATAVVETEVDANENATHYQLAYGLGSSLGCRIGRDGGSGDNGVPLEHTTVLEPIGVADAQFHPVEISVSGLTQGTEYCTEVIAENGVGIEHGKRQYFIAGAPRASSVDAYSTGISTATVVGEVNPAGEEAHYKVVYGLEGTSPWCNSGGRVGGPEQATTPATLAYTDAKFHPVAVGLTGLRSGSEYCAELVTTDSSGTEHSRWLTFTTTPAYRLNVTLDGTGSGTVTGAGISCPGTCSQGYAVGAHVALIAAPAAGSTFTGWNGPCTGTGACDVTLSEARSVVASFTANAPPARPAAFGSVSLIRSTIILNAGGKTGFELACAGTSTCGGKLTLTATVTTKKGKKRRTRTETIGVAAFSIAPGTMATIGLKLNGIGRALFRTAHGSLGAALTISKTSPSPSNSQTKIVHLAVQKAKKGTR